ncbi:MAG: Na(+)/H(+) antiporter subunit D [Ignavibacteriaceae bacterium]
MMFNDFLNIPALILIAGAFILPLIPKNLRSAVFLIFPLISLYIIWILSDGFILTVNIANYDLVLCKVDKLSKVFGYIFAIITFIGGVYSYHIKETGQQSAALLYAGGAMGVAFTGDYITFYLFWELMAVASTYLIWARRTPQAKQAGMRYILVHIFGGSLALAGIILHVTETGSILISSLAPDGRLASILILIGVAINAAIPPLHAWLADAYPKATVTGAVFLSAFTTKTSVYVLLRIFPGWEILIFFGVAMALYGVVYAVLANDIRELLAYHIISQVGYMVAAAGLGTEMAINGAAAHAFSHILYKALLFMGAGAVLYSTGRSRLTELGGLAKAMPVVLGLYMIGAFSISGFPLFNGFISKSIIVAAAGTSQYDTAMLLLMLASIGTFLHTGLKLPYFTWFGESKEKISPAKIPVNMIIGMAAAAFLCTLFGIAPSLLYIHLPYPINYQPYTLYHLMETTQILIFTFIAFWAFRKKLAGEDTIALDSDWLYRRYARSFKKIFVDEVDFGFNIVENLFARLTASLVEFRKNPLVLFSRKEDEYYDPDKQRPSSQFLIMLILASFLLIALISII